MGEMKKSGAPERVGAGDKTDEGTAPGSAREPDLRSAVLNADRSLVLRLLSREGITQGVFRTFGRAEWERSRSSCILEIEMAVGFPCRVRPAAGGPYEARMCRSRPELEAALEAALNVSARVVAEEWLEGRRLYVAVGGAPSWARSAAGERLALRAARTDGNNDGPGGSNSGGSGSAPDHEGELSLREAKLADDAEERLDRLSRSVWEALDAEGPILLRFVEAAGGTRYVLEETDLLPELGLDSFYARLWELSGVGYPELLARFTADGESKGSRSASTGEGWSSA